MAISGFESMELGKKKEIELDGCRITYSLRTSSRARNLRITVKSGGAVLATKPRFVSEKTVEDFLIKKSTWILDRIEQSRQRQKFLVSGNRADYKYHAAAARQLALQKIADFNHIYKVKFNRVAIRNQTTRWGSCSCLGNLNFNYRIALLPERLADYIVVHEICHLRELNHSARFWALVAQAIPDYAARRRELRQDYC